MKRISVIIPCRNEEKTIFSCLEGLNQQTIPMEAAEVVIADGLSTDATRQEIVRFERTGPRFSIRLIDNPERTIPSALNHAIEAAEGEYIVRMDAHSRPNPNYIEKIAAHLEKGTADNVGGIWIIRPGADTWLARAIAAAASHKLGVGNALYRYTTKAEFVDTVPFGGFRKDLFNRVGRFDETLLTNEDYEFNSRILKNGGKIYLDPEIRCEYFARPDLVELTRQYWRYGFWKQRMLRRYPSTIKARQLLPPVFVLTLLLTGLLAVIFWPFRWLFGAEILLYLLTLCLASIPEAAKGKDIRLLIGIPLAIATMHVCWGSGFLFSMLKR